MKHLKRITLVLVLLFAAALTVCATDDLAWEFDIERDELGWRRTNCSGEVTGGYFNCTAIPNGAGSYDPFISHDVDFKAEDNRYIVISMKWENARVLSTGTSIYFKTDTAGLSESTRVSNPEYEGKTTGGKYLVQVFDMSVNENWKGQVQNIRIDTIGSGGDFSVDYIRVTNELPETYDIITLSANADGKQETVSYFAETRAYTDGLFTDMTKDDWYYDSVAKAYSLGFMNGIGEGLFSPEGNMTVAEAVTIAARMHSIYRKNGAEFKANGEWYAPYLEYAASNGLLEGVSTDNPDANILRAEMATLFDGLLPDSYMTSINTVGFVPDVPVDAAYREAVLALYNTGILMGSDAYGSFYPESEITRAEAAAIINRMALPDMRVKGSLLAAQNEKEPFQPKSAGHFLIDNPTMIFGTSLQTGFDYNLAGGKANYTGASTNVLDDMRENTGSFIKRKIQKQSDGILHLICNYKLGYDPNGAYFRMADENGGNLFYLFTKDKKYYLADGDVTVPLGIRAQLGKMMCLEADIDLDAKRYALYLNGGYCGEYAFAGESKNAAFFEVGTTDEGTPMVNVSSMFLTKDYYMLDDFHADARGAFAYTADENAVYTVNGELQVTAKAGSSFEAQADFDAAQGTICFETLFYADKISDGLGFAFTNGEETALSLTVKDGKFTTGSGKTLDKTIAGNLWNLLRVEADTDGGNAVVKLNGKVLGEVPFDQEAKALDGVRMICRPKADMLFKADEAYVTKLFDYADYCPAPQVVESDYILGINVCSIWREGYHTGWGAISPYPELEPVLGFYDEGLPEAADWEIKFWAEHGIDYQLLCWYGNGRNGAIKMGRGSTSELHEGYFNAKYSDLVKFAIMWENSSNTTTLEKFKENVVPYWVEYYLTDPRYMTVDNKPIITVWSVGALVSEMGLDGAREAVEYLRETCKDLGYDDCLFLCADSHSTRPDQFKNLASIGCDATYAYHWNVGGAKYYNQTARMSNYLKYNADETVPDEEKIPLIPTVSVGFNSIGWHGSRTGLIDVEGHGKVADFVKSDVLPTLKGTAMENMVIISTWNEYGEGTYMMPSVELGFRYLDSVRTAFTDGGEHKDVTPTDAQKARLGYLYPQDRRILKPLYKEDISEYPQTVKHQIKLTSENMQDYELFSQEQKSINEQGNYTAVSTGNSIIFNKEPLNIPIDNCSYIRITMRGTKDSEADNLSGHFFFATDSYPKIEEATRTTFSYPNGGELATYYVNMAANSRWHGTLTTLRVDPISGSGTFEIESVEILQDDAKIPVKINGTTVKTYGIPDTDNGVLLVPAAQNYGFFTSLAASYEWDSGTGVLTVNANNHEVTFTRGSDKAVVDGAEKQMYTSIAMFDGVPLIPLDFLAEALGYEYLRTDTAIDITTPFQ